MQNHSVTSGSSPVDKAHPTLGPWKIGDFEEYLVYGNMTCGIRCGPAFLDISDYGIKHKAKMLADAALIASAPDLKAENIRLKAINEELLAALETCFVDALGNAHFNVPMVQAAISKARGQE